MIRARLIPPILFLLASLQCRLGHKARLRPAHARPARDRHGAPHHPDEVVGSNPRTNLILNRDQAKPNCPDLSEACKRRGFLVQGDDVLRGRDPQRHGLHQLYLAE